MDESYAGFLHGGRKRCRDLETVLHSHSRNRTVGRSIQSMGLRFDFGGGFSYHPTVHQSTEDGDRPASPQTRSDCAHGSFTKREASIHDAF